MSTPTLQELLDGAEKDYNHPSFGWDDLEVMIREAFVAGTFAVARRPKHARDIRHGLAWLLYGWSLPAGELPDELPTVEFDLWEVKARGILSLIADKLEAAGYGEAALFLDGSRTARPHRGGQG